MSSKSMTSCPSIIAINITTMFAKSISMISNFACSWSELDPFIWISLAILLTLCENSVEKEPKELVRNLAVPYLFSLPSNIDLMFFATWPAQSSSIPLRSANIAFTKHNELTKDCGFWCTQGHRYLIQLLHSSSVSLVMIATLLFANAQTTSHS